MEQPTNTPERLTLSQLLDYYAKLELNVHAKEGESLLYTSFEQLRRQSLSSTDKTKFLSVELQALQHLYDQEVSYYQQELKYKEKALENCSNAYDALKMITDK